MIAHTARVLGRAAGAGLSTRVLPASQRFFCSAEDKTKEYLKEFVKDNRIVLFMKGNPTFPQCGFSRMVAEVLKREGLGEDDYVSVDVLEHPHIRDGIKEFSDWPTIPQLYINGEFIGGCDIVVDMHKSGEIKDILAKKSEAQ
eukprot:GEMP01052459.1.p2 GENE.GEMP01052459.1~~GEMP01052459.1.p2  ORF type:complete len:143 (+),score=28.28 GEMP01052459.1:77-505(+)